MAGLEEKALRELSEAFAFAGNSLLKPIGQTSRIGLDSRFWSAFPTFDEAAIESAVDRCGEYAQNVSRESANPEGANSGIDKAVEQISVEWTYLFVGPPAPSAAPWETFYLSDAITTGFGQPTIEMRELLGQAGLQVGGGSRQYEDHMGIELLLLSRYCAQLADGAEDTATTKRTASYIKAHPQAWIDKLEKKIHEHCPDGYYDCILGLANALLAYTASLLDSNI